VQFALTVPTIRDRAVMMAAVLVLDPIFEADLPPEQYAYRRGRSALDAVRHVHKLINTGHREIVDADLTGYFDSLPHAELLKSAARRVVDGAMLHLIKMWLTAPVEETDERRRRHRNTRNRDEVEGPSGISDQPAAQQPLHASVRAGVEETGHEKRLGACIVNYADDLVICCRGSAEDALTAMRVMMTKLNLTVNETKTRVAKLPEEKFDFLGCTFGRCYSTKTGRAYLGTVPAKKRVIRICQAISNETSKSKARLIMEQWSRSSPYDERLGKLLLPWSGQQSLCGNRATCRRRLRRWLCAKHKLARHRPGNIRTNVFTTSLV